MNIHNEAPVKHSDSVVVNASVEKIWRIMSDIEKWPDWNPEITWTKLNGKLEPGTTFVWKAGPGTITSTLEEVSAPRLIAWSGKLFGIRAIHIWRIGSKEGLTTVTTEESWDGLIPKLLKRSSEKALVKAIEKGLAQLKIAAESPEK